MSMPEAIDSPQECGNIHWLLKPLSCPKKRKGARRLRGAENRFDWHYIPLGTQTVCRSRR